MSVTNVMRGWRGRWTRMLLPLAAIVVLTPVLVADAYAAPVRDKGAMLRERRASEGAKKVDQGLNQALNLAKRRNLNAWNQAKDKIVEARYALRIMEGSGATRDNADTKRYRATIEGRVDEIYAAADGWLPAALGDVEPREDKYDGSDREDIRDEIAAAWKAEWPTDEIVAIRFHRDEWNRTVERLPNGVVVKDFQFLEVIVYVKESDHIATGWPAYKNRDNLTGSESTGVETKVPEFISHDVPMSAF